MSWGRTDCGREEGAVGRGARSSRSPIEVDQKAIADRFDWARPYAALEFLLLHCLPELLGTDLDVESSVGPG
jgi:hypothetical protein